MRNTDIVVDNLKNYIILPGKRYGTYVYPDLNVAMHRLGYNEELKQVANSLSIIGNTAKEANGHEYIGNINWEQALKLNLLRNKETFNIRQILDFKTLLEQGIDKKKKVNDGNDKIINPKILMVVYDEIYGIRYPWRGEWLDNGFMKVNDIFCVGYDHKIINGKLFPSRIEPLEECLMENCRVDLKSFNKQGLPTKEGDDFNYWYPGDNSVAGFDASSDRADLYCGRSPRGSSAARGVHEIFVRGEK